jgi:hypothetical protein
MASPNRFQFGLGAVMIGVTLFAVILSAAKTLGWNFLPGFSGLAWSIAFTLLLAWVLMPLDQFLSRLPYWTSFIVAPILYAILNFVFFLFGEAIDQPHPAYLDGSTWLDHAVANGLQFTPYVVIATFIIMAIDCAVQRSRPRNGAYYPRLSSVWLGLGSVRVRLVLTIGLLLVIGYYSPSVIEVWRAHQSPGGWVWPPKRVYAACHFLWSLLWIADCQSRPNRGTMAAAIGCLVMTYLLLPNGGVVRE